jgi:DUF4097 and DUF4098 domain-containing protein YvlB
MPLLGLAAIVVGLGLLGNSGRLPITGGFIEHTKTFGDSYSVQNLVLDAGNGNITLARAAGDEVELQAISHGYGWTPGAAEQAATRIAPQISVQGDTLRIEEDRFNAINLFGRSSYVEYRIALPADVSANLATGSGEFDVDGIAGALELRTGSGDITLRNGQGQLQADTGSGDITVEELSGELSVRTGSGDIGVDGVSGSITADTGSGNIEVSNADAATVELQTGSGDVGFDGSLQAEGTNSINTGSGNIRLELPEDAGVELSARTGSGDINIDDAWQATVDENSATAQLGSGDATLELRASSGNISVEAE